MLSISFVFWLLIFIFALIGAMRGWGKELLVTFSIILALFVIQLVHAHVPPIARMLSSKDPRYQFYLWTALVTTFALFGYHTPKIPRVPKIVGGNLARERLQDWLLGGVLGAINGYLLVGTIWFYLDFASYPFPEHIMTAPGEDSAASQIIALLPPTWLGVPIIYIAVAIAFTLVVVVFI